MSSVHYKAGKVGLAVAGMAFHIAFYVCMAVLIFWAGKYAYSIGYQVFNQQAVSPGEGQEVMVDIPSGTSDYQIAKILKANGLIRDAQVFYLQEFLSGYHGKLRPGVYQLSTAYTPMHIMSVLAGEEDEEEKEAVT